MASAGPDLQLSQVMSPRAWGCTVLLMLSHALLMNVPTCVGVYRDLPHIF